MKSKPIIFVLFISLFLFNACKEEYNKDLNYQELTLDEFQTDSYVLRVFEEVEELTASYIQGTGYPSETARNYWSGTNPDNSSTVTVFYTNYENPNSTLNYVLNGSIVVKVTGNIGSPNFIREVSFTNFKINGYQLSGKIIFTTSALNCTKITFESFKITYSDQTFYTRNGSLFFVTIHGESSYEIWDNTYQITGAITGINRSNVSFTSSIINPIVKKLDYKHYISGKVNLTFDEAPVLIDFGNSVLDNLVILTIDGEEFPNVALKN